MRLVMQDCGLDKQKRMNSVKPWVCAGPERGGGGALKKNKPQSKVAPVFKK